MDTSVKIGAVLILLMIGFGVYQSFDAGRPDSSLAGAVPLEQRSQEQINGCMKECMRSCVIQESLVPSCTESCEQKCGA